MRGCAAHRLQMRIVRIRADRKPSRHPDGTTATACCLRREGIGGCVRARTGPDPAEKTLQRKSLYQYRMDADTVILVHSQQI